MQLALSDEEPASSQTLTVTDGLTAIGLSCAPGLAFSRIQSSATLDTPVSQPHVDYLMIVPNITDDGLNTKEAIPY